MEEDGGIQQTSFLSGSGIAHSPHTLSTELAELSDTLWGLLQVQNSLRFVNLGHESSVREQADTLSQASGCDTGGLFQNFQATFSQIAAIGRMLFLKNPPIFIARWI